MFDFFSQVLLIQQGNRSGTSAAACPRPSPGSCTSTLGVHGCNFQVDDTKLYAERKLVQGHARARCNFQMDDTKGDRKVHIQGDTSANSGTGSGTAYIQKQGGGFVVQITDRRLSDDTCMCSPPRPPASSR